MSSPTFPPTDQKVVELPALLQTRARWRLLGQQVVFTNGVFDLMHPGHIQVLEEARAQGDVLVVGLNADHSVKRLKGPSRPILPQDARARLIAALACVDRVVLFEDDTPLALIEALQPDVLVKGADYHHQAVVGAELVTARGGRVHLVQLVPDHSTTRLVERIRT